MVVVKASKSILNVVKGDNIKVDGAVYEVDAHYVMMEHDNNKEMIIELFDPKNDKDFQIRYFDDQVEDSMKFYILKDIIYEEQDIEKVEW